MEPITSLKNDRVKLAYGLQNRKGTRRKERKIALEGTRLVGDAVKARHNPLFVLYDPAKVDYELLAVLQNRCEDVLPASPEVMQHISATETPQGILAVFHMPFPTIPKKPSRVLLMDNVREPGNVGGIMRTAAASGVEVVLLSPGCADPYNPKTLRSGMGAHFRIPIIEDAWYKIEQYCAHLNIYLAAGDGELDYAEVNWSQDWALVIGSEAHGVMKSVESFPDAKRIHIPMAVKTESLNAGVAAGIILFEAQRMRRMKG